MEIIIANPPGAFCNDCKREDKMQKGLISALLSFFCCAISLSAQAGFHKGIVAYMAEDYKTALREFKPLAEKGNVNAQYYLATLYDNGREVRKDTALAAQWYIKSAEQGNSDAQYNLGIMYSNGDGVEKDFQQAAQWYRKATELGDMDAQTNLATLYSNGTGVKKDLAQALILYRRAADRGHVLAQYNLAIMLELGEGGPKDPAAALRWYKRAAEATPPDPDAAARLAKAYKNGELGLEANAQLAKEWQGKADKAR
jgi:TPR repeat protein